MRVSEKIAVSEARQWNAGLLALLERPWARWAAVLLWMALIFAFSAQSRLPSLPQQDTLFKKAAHVMVYAVLALLAWRAFAGWRWPGLAAFLLAVLYALSDEWHQSFVPGRHPAASDVLIDAAGAACALVLVWWNKKRKGRGGTASPKPHL